MDRGKIMDFLNLVEDALPVNQWKWDGISVWPLFRVLTYFQNIQREEFSRVDSKFHSCYKKTKSACSSLVSYYKASFVDRKKSDYCEGKRDIVFMTDALSRVKVNHFWYLKEYDSIAKVFKEENLSFLCLEFTRGGEYRLPRYSPSRLIDKDLLIIRGASSIFKTVCLDDSFFYFLEQINLLTKKNEEGLKFPSKERLYLLLRYIRSLAEFYKKIFLKVVPSVGMVVCYYSVAVMAFILACNEFGIPSIDIQHGVQGDLHVAYGRWNAISGEGYNLLPDYFWCWSDEEAHNIYSWSGDHSKRHKPIVGGNLFLEQVQSGEIFFEEEESFKEKIKKSLFTKHILVTLQPINYKETLNKLFNCIGNSPEEWMWWIRLHTGMYAIKQEIVKFLEEKASEFKNIDINKATDLPLYLLLKYMDVHITSSSSSVIEAEAFGVQSIIIDRLGASYYKRQIECQKAIYAEDEESIVNALFKIEGERSLNKTINNRTSQAIARMASLLKSKEV
jgi:hypothetical protein